MNLNPDTFFAMLAEELRSPDSFDVAFPRALAWCAEHLPHDDWNKIGAADYSADLARARLWVTAVLKKHPCPFPIRGLYFGLAEMSNARGEEFADLYVGFLGQYDSSDAQASWLHGELRHYPDNSSLKVRLLREAGVRFNRESGRGLGNDGNFAFCLVYACLLVKEILTPELQTALGGGDVACGVVCGWDSGDTVRLGELPPTGFRPNPGPMI
jgi:hypothetical protein